ncbi:MAG: tyrosine-type recombinase/integrase [Faecousia sp.]
MSAAESYAEACAGTGGDSQSQIPRLRHTFATIALQNGVDIKTVSGMLGHFSAGFTLDAYAHVTTSAQKETAQTMENILGIETIMRTMQATVPVHRSLQKPFRKYTSGILISCYSDNIP